MLELKNFNKVYLLDDEEVHAVKDISLDFNRGELVSILGLSGSGKTTLVSMIGGLEEPSSGELLIDGINTTSFKQKHWTDYRKNTIGFVFQDFNLIEHLTAIDNIKIALSLSGISEAEKERRAVELLKLVSMVDQRSQFPSEMSGGQQQRIAIARALANDPEIILADEPTGALDPDTSVQIMNLLQELTKQGHLVIMVTHDKYLARDYSSRIVELENGAVINDTSTSSVKKIDANPTIMAKSSLEWKAAFKIAFNNLKKRKKSSLIAMFSLIPSIIIVMIFGNFIFNLMTYQDDLDPIYKGIVNEENISYIASQSEGNFEIEAKFAIVGLDNGNNDIRRINIIEENLFEPYTDEEITEMESLDNIERVIEPNYYDVNIDGNRFILVGLLPEEYKKYQYDFDFGYYPKDNERGLIFSKGAAEILIPEDAMSLEGQEINFDLTSFNSIPLHARTYEDDSNKFSAPVLKVFDPNPKTVLMSSYYKGYIYAPIDYINEIRDRFTVENVSLASYTVLGVLSPDAVEGKYLFNGAQYLTDLLEPVRSRTRFGNDLDIFTFKEYPLQTPTSNFMMRHMIISKGPLTETDMNFLSSYGPHYRSKYDEFAVDSAIETNAFINQLLLSAKIIVGVVVTLPSVLVTLILYISILLRTKEIGVLKSIGAKNKDIVTIFTMESGILASISGIVAVAISYPILTYVRQLVETEYEVSYHLGSNPLDTNIFALLGSLFAIIFLTTLLGLLPGRKASKLHPRELLRSIN